MSWAKCSPARTSHRKGRYKAPVYTGCGLEFTDDFSFDAHRVGDHEYTFTEGLAMDPPREDGRRCLSLDEMEEAGWDKDKHGRWRAPGRHPKADRPPVEEIVL